MLGITQVMVDHTTGSGGHTVSIDEAIRQAEGQTAKAFVMTLSLQADPVPLREDVRGGYRVGNSRVPLEVVLAEYQDGADPESIVNAYPTLELADVYAVITYYLRHRDDVNAWLGKREAGAAELRREIESHHKGRADLRAKLLARRNRQEQGHGSPRS
jgi:uncharacterized protein (DUF433 family)